MGNCTSDTRTTVELEPIDMEAIKRWIDDMSDESATIALEDAIFEDEMSELDNMIALEDALFEDEMSDLDNMIAFEDEYESHFKKRI